MKFQKKFLKDARNISFDEKHRRTINFNISKYDAAVANGRLRYENIALARERAADRKRTMLNDWDNYLLQFEKNITKRGAKVLWAQDTTEAINMILFALRRLLYS